MSINQLQRATGKFCSSHHCGAVNSVQLAEHHIYSDCAASQFVIYRGVVSFIVVTVIAVREVIVQSSNCNCVSASFLAYQAVEDGEHSGQYGTSASCHYDELQLLLYV